MAGLKYMTLYVSYRRHCMSNSLEDQPEQQQQPPQQAGGRPDNLVAFRIRPEHPAFYRRLATFLNENGFITEPSLNKAAYMCMIMIGKRYEKQEQENLERPVAKRLAEARAKVNPRFSDENYFY